VIQLIWIALVAAVALVLARFSSWLPYTVGGLFVLLASGWVLTSTLWPSRPDRRCPKCSRPGLIKIERGRPGVRCELCGHEDPTLHVAYLDDW
jgi:hypothetical protein